MKKLLIAVLTLACALTFGGCRQIETPFTRQKPHGIKLTQNDEREQPEFREPDKGRTPPFPKPIPVPAPQPVQPR